MGPRSPKTSPRGLLGTIVQDSDHNFVDFGTILKPFLLDFGLFWCQPLNQHTNRPIDQSTNQATKQPTNQTSKHPDIPTSQARGRLPKALRFMHVCIPHRALCPGGVFLVCSVVWMGLLNFLRNDTTSAYVTLRRPKPSCVTC